ncbi:hypothetical protein M407DRAFT_92215 [Tulasnella calospora MUT 4182]|uniref:Uncharacterized protein n=1 Tax=Tulasnella calospora MUT 4182 TaxID=1051891 RepID=A0A0C3QHT9_9AGAM|nr:hypothetical protein M407DRAFT_92215 [Tulasnella calospora MUT 4182]
MYPHPNPPPTRRVAPVCAPPKSIYREYIRINCLQLSELASLSKDRVLTQAGSWFVAKRPRRENFGWRALA